MTSTEGVKPVQVEDILSRLNQFTTCGCCDDDWPQLRHDTVKLIHRLTHQPDTDDDPDEAYKLGKEDGYSEALADVDRRTGGDGEYFASTVPGRGCPDASAMLAKIVARFEAQPDTAAQPVASSVYESAVKGRQEFRQAYRDLLPVQRAAAALCLLWRTPGEQIGSDAFMEALNDLDVAVCGGRRNGISKPILEALTQPVGDVERALRQLEAAATLVTEWLDRVNDRDGTALGGPQWFELGRAIAQARAALSQHPDPQADAVERQKIVAWLRREGRMYLDGVVNGSETETITGAALQVFADAIEQGEMG